MDESYKRCIINDIYLNYRNKVCLLDGATLGNWCSVRGYETFATEIAYDAHVRRQTAHA